MAEKKCSQLTIALWVGRSESSDGSHTINGTERPL